MDGYVQTQHDLVLGITRKNNIYTETSSGPFTNHQPEIKGFPLIEFIYNQNKANIKGYVDAEEIGSYKTK